jgi:predicted AAA+ superfamily ATPase
MINLVFPQAVSRETDFYDRVPQAERVKRDFLYDGQRLVLVMGERRAGKTSFMLVTQERFAANLSCSGSVNTWASS